MDLFNGHAAEGAVALSLSSRARRDRIRVFHEGWEVELKSGRDHIVARTRKVMSQEALLNEAIEMAHRALDIGSIEDADHLVTSTPADTHIILQRRNGQTVVRFQDVLDIMFRLEIEVEVLSDDGNVKPQSQQAPIVWSPALRFYRLAQSGRDLFEAYRNMFLGLEALLDQLWPKAHKEREKDWLLRAINSASAKVSLVNLVPLDTSDPARHLVDVIYGVRLRLFHAKTGRTLIPDERVSYTKVADTYPILVSLWTEVVRQWIGPVHGSGGLTYAGFQHLVNFFSSVRMAVTEDDSPFSAEDKLASPKGSPVTLFGDPMRIVAIKPGRSAVIGVTKVSDLPRGQVVGRVVGIELKEGIPAFISAIKGGLTLDRADVFETSNVARLVNRNEDRYSR